jgi:hypothetical protein
MLVILQLKRKALTGKFSVHAGETRGLVPKDWPRHDPEGFSQVEAIMVDFAHGVFCKWSTGGKG